MPCPSCRSNNFYRSHARSAVERLARATLLVHYYRCHDCGWRGPRSAIKWKNISSYIVSVLYVAFIGGLVIALVGLLLFLLVFR
jgi:predicted RNA-binding Zn-ribbon protein involved in translation (DUF1610 family)